ncbi:hypothetical protein CLIB1423_01S04698 [[Candida] railenensis]|uniref:Peptidase A1 domain-containing protein n=1 Tax=[Candida] railenensis TaxID=45579 RepID=A0A9P0QKM9_9ASCO|nr:hypothetical protein CLIB1423_01S04698 [[Candida] railenensis]
MYFTRSVNLLLATALVAAQDGFLKMGFDVLKGDSLPSALQDYARSHHHKHGHHHRRDGSEFLSLELANADNFYVAKVSVGTPGQEISVVLDTGSSDLWITASSNPKCIANGGTIDCEEFGSFDYTESSTFKNAGTALDITYIDGTNSKGYWASDSVAFGTSSTIPNVTFGVANVTDSSAGVCGLSFPILQRNPTQYDNLPILLKKQGVIQSESFSLYLTSETATTGNILFGAYDNAKFEGTLEEIPIPQVATSKGAMVYAYLWIPLDSVSLKIGNTTTSSTTSVSSTISSIASSSTSSSVVTSSTAPSSTLSSNVEPSSSSTLSSSTFSSTSSLSSTSTASSIAEISSVVSTSSSLISSSGPSSSSSSAPISSSVTSSTVTSSSAASSSAASSSAASSSAASSSAASSSAASSSAASSSAASSSIASSSAASSSAASSSAASSISSSSSSVLTSSSTIPSSTSSISSATPTSTTSSSTAPSSSSVITSPSATPSSSTKQPSSSTQASSSSLKASSNEVQSSSTKPTSSSSPLSSSSPSTSSSKPSSTVQSSSSSKPSSSIPSSTSKPSSTVQASSTLKTSSTVKTSSTTSFKSSTIISSTTTKKTSTTTTKATPTPTPTPTNIPQSPGCASYDIWCNIWSNAGFASQKPTSIINNIVKQIQSSLARIQQSFSNLFGFSFKRREYKGAYDDLADDKIDKRESRKIYEEVNAKIVREEVQKRADSDSDTIEVSSTSFILDSGTTYSYLPDALNKQIALKLDPNATLQGSGMYKVDCSLMVDDNYLVFTFQSKDIEVPLTRLITQSGSTCSLGFVSSATPIFGDNFLRSCYTLFNLDAKTISIAQINYTDDEDIQVIS